MSVTTDKSTVILLAKLDEIEEELIQQMLNLSKTPPVAGYEWLAFAIHHNSSVKRYLRRYEDERHA